MKIRLGVFLIKKVEYGEKSNNVWRVWKRELQNKKNSWMEIKNLTKKNVTKTKDILIRY